MGKKRTARRNAQATAPQAAQPRRHLWIGGGAALIAVAAAVWVFGVRTPPDAAARDGSPAWSPDSRRLAFYSERGGDADIYVMDADGRAVRRLTSDKADEGYPSWSSDGRTITFDSDRAGNFEIFAMNADGSNVRRLTNHPARDVSAAWAPDGSAIAFMSDRDGGFDVYLMDADGSNQRRATTTGTA